jgi:putative flippase GtrA
MVRFGVVGVTTQLVYLGSVVAVMAAGLHYFVALLVAQICAIGFAFPMYRHQVFRSEGPVRAQFAAFLGVWWAGAAASLLGVPLLVEGTALNPLLAQVAVMLVVAVWGFLGHSRISFRQRGPKLGASYPSIPEASS